MVCYLDHTGILDFGADREGSIRRFQERFEVCDGRLIGGRRGQGNEGDDGHFVMKVDGWTDLKEAM